MIEIERFRAADLKEIFEQKAMAYMSEFITDEQRKEMEKGEWAFTGKVNGRVVACGGVALYWPGRGEAWAIIDQQVKVEFLRIHRAALRVLEMCPLQRIEATVDEGFEPGHRWAGMLGFKLEAPSMKKFRPDGKNASLYALVR